MTLLSLQEAARKKQLGQYFTGQRVGRLLAALASAETAKSIIDPMAGSADLLVSCLAIGAEPERLVGLELDPLALAQAKAVLDGVRGVDLILTDAFSATLPAEQFALVIANPPYIRYQAKGEVDGISIPSSEAVRDGLVRAIKARGALSKEARARLLYAAWTYPGTADIAVPAWILSASLVREDGVLAVVAPQAWLSRNYAHAVRQLLDEAFDVDVIVEDGDASWFDDAQVRTHLVVAHRRAIEARSATRSVMLARATCELDSSGALRGSLGSEQAVAAALRKVFSSHSVEVTTGLTAHVEHDLSVAAAGQAGNIPARVAATLSLVSGEITTRTLGPLRLARGKDSDRRQRFLRQLHGQGARPHAGNNVAPHSSGACSPPFGASELGESLDIHVGISLPSRIVNLRGWVTAADKGRWAPSAGVRVLPNCRMDRAGCLGSAL